VARSRKAGDRASIIRQSAISPAALTPPIYAAQLVGQAGQVGNLLFDFGQVLGADPVNLNAGLILLRGQAQQIPHLIEAEPQIPASADEAQPVQMIGPIGAIVARRSWRRGQQPCLLEIADRDDLRAGRLRQIANCRRSSMTLTL
jgi:hypothetical protein